MEVEIWSWGFGGSAWAQCLWCGFRCRDFERSDEPLRFPSYAVFDKAPSMRSDGGSCVGGRVIRFCRFGSGRSCCRRGHTICPMSSKPYLAMLLLHSTSAGAIVASTSLQPGLLIIAGFFPRFHAVVCGRRTFPGYSF